MPMYDAEDIVELKNKTKRKRRLVRLIVILFLAGAGAALYLTHEIWLPKLRGIGEQAYTTIVNDGRLAEGNFPIEVSSGGDYQLETSEKILGLLSDSYVFFYNEEGGLIKKRQHAYTNAVLSMTGGRALIYESGGNDFSVETPESVLYKGRTDKNILFARLSDEGLTAVVTNSDNYDCEINVYDKKGEIIYSRKCIEKVNDIAFKENGKGCMISYIYAENGSLATSVQDVTFTESGEKWTSPGLDTLGLEVFACDEGAFILGIDACGYVDGSGNISSYYSYEGDFAGGDSSGGKSAVIVNNDDRRRYEAALFSGGGKEPIIIESEHPLLDVVVSGELAYIMSKDTILAYDFDGSLRSTVQINDSYTGFVRSEDLIFLKGFGKIDRIDYDS